MLKGFKDFVMRGNLVELAVAFVVGAAFATVITAFTGLVLAVIALALGSSQPDMDDFAPAGLPVGTFVTAVVTFLLLAAIVYFLVVVPYNKVQARMSRGEEPAPPSPDIALLTEIRDLLAERPGETRVRGGDGVD